MARNGENMSKQKYTVMVDDNFHFMDESERYKMGEYESYDEAVSRCKAIVDDYLHSALEPNMTAEELYSSYTMFGEDPYISNIGIDKFSSWDYAKVRCKEFTKY